MEKKRKDENIHFSDECFVLNRRFFLNFNFAIQYAFYETAINPTERRRNARQTNSHVFIWSVQYRASEFQWRKKNVSIKRTQTVAHSEIARTK